MIKKILIANRGEIACRVIRTARKLNISTVAVYSDADKDSLFVKQADESYHIGGSQPAESYLDINKIINIAKKSKADAIHPGYGFLSENAAFVKRLAKEKIKFIGPNPNAIKKMGDKIESKNLAIKLKLNVIPGHTAPVKNSKEALKISNKIGYPVLLKASAGGGGKGMRIVRKNSELEENFNAAKSESKKSFGDDRVFIEKYIEQPRHIEIQILCDKHGNQIHLGERECSIQRRYQKVIEECPSPFVDEEMRNEMAAQALTLAKEVKYDSAGTVEFVVDANKNFYFLEMNTRLQVEHPVTELVTGFDLVEEMIKIAAGEKLNISQKDVKFSGWAIESRIYAEDPERNFMPSTGRLITYKPPTSIDNIRNDTGVYEGGEISMFYDPMISKLCSYGENRKKACELMQEALNNYEISGIQNNLNLLSSIIKNEKFISGDINTGFIAEEYPDGFNSKVVDKEDSLNFSLASIFAFLKIKNRNKNIDLMNNSKFNERTLFAHINKDVFEFKTYNSQKNSVIEYDGNVITLESDWCIGDKVMKIKIDEVDFTFQINKTLKGYHIQGYGMSGLVKIRSKIANDLSSFMIEKIITKDTKIIKCPMPGLIVSIDIEEGQSVEDGDKLCVVEAMKMENIIRSETSGVIKKIHCKEGDSLATDAVMIEFE